MRQNKCTQAPRPRRPGQEPRQVYISPGCRGGQVAETSEHKPWDIREGRPEWAEKWTEGVQCRVWAQGQDRVYISHISRRVTSGAWGKPTHSAKQVHSLGAEKRSHKTPSSKLCLAVQWGAGLGTEAPAKNQGTEVGGWLQLGAGTVKTCWKGFDTAVKVDVCNTAKARRTAPKQKDCPKTYWHPQNLLVEADYPSEMRYRYVNENTGTSSPNQESITIH